jgi:DNA primase
MRRYTDEELRRLKEEVDLAQLVQAAGVELKPVGQDLRGRCPFHEDKGPSLVVTKLDDVIPYLRALPGAKVL